ncbi:MAG: 30S ribosomal protein S16 [Candidatus Yanofskybacteria bacterium]|nr:30S ribosomal protein S16 [Candidatus Yanofskybacteria bacterium]
MIRLQRIGKRGQAYFRVVLVEHTKKPKGEIKELLGTYDPHLKKFVAKKERIEYWVSKGAQPSPTVNNLLVNYKVWDKPKKQSWKPKKKDQATASATPTTPGTPAPAAQAAPEPTKPETPAEEPAPETPIEPEAAAQAAA